MKEYPDWKEESPKGDLYEPDQFEESEDENTENSDDPVDPDYDD